MNAKIINNNININNKSIDKTLDKSLNKNGNLNSQDTISIPEKLISVNKNVYKKNNSRNNNLFSNNYASCENILINNLNTFKNKLLISKKNPKNQKSKEKKISRKKLFSPLHEYNSFKYISTPLINNNKEPDVSVPKSIREINLSNKILTKQNTNINNRFLYFIA